MRDFADTLKIDNLACLEIAISLDNQPCPQLVQRHVFKIAFMSAQVHGYVRSAEYLSMDDFRTLSTQLESWHYELPESLQLSFLTSPNIDTNSIRRPVFFMHMIHISSYITVHEWIVYRNLKDLIGTSDNVLIQEVFRLPSDSLETYWSFAQQLARIIKLLYDEECVLARCWLTM